MNSLRVAFTLLLIAAKLPAMGSTSSPVCLVPKEVIKKILGYLYEPHKKYSKTQIIRFLRTNKNFYNSEELASFMMARIRILYPYLNLIDKWIQSAKDFGTPAAVQVLKKHLIAHPSNWPDVHRYYAYMVVYNERRAAQMLKTIGANLNVPVNGKRESAFLVVAQVYSDVPNLERLLNGGSDINSSDVDGNNILMLLTRQMPVTDLLPSIRFLIDRGINLNHCTNAGRSAVAIADIHGNYRVQKVIEDAGGKNIGYNL